MKLNFMHILADLGFGGVSPIDWIKKDEHAIKYIYKLVKSMQTYKNQKRYNLDKNTK